MRSGGSGGALAGRRLDLAVLALWLGVTAAVVAHHEPFRDEAQKWLIARDAPSVGALLRLMPSEGSPALWPLLLRPLARLGLPYGSMSWLNWLLAAAAAALLWLRAPLPRALRLATLFSYPLLYDLPAIARNYALATLLLFAAVASFPLAGRRPLAYAALLGLLMNANVFGAAVAAALGALLLADLARSPTGRRAAPAAGLLLAVAAAALLLQVVPRDGVGTLAEVVAAPSLARGPALIAGTAATLRAALDSVVSYYPWAGALGAAGAAALVIAALGWLALFATSLVARPRALFVLAGAVALPLYLVVWKVYLSRQYLGALLVGVVAAAWFAAIDVGPAGGRAPVPPGPDRAFARLHPLALRLLLVPLAAAALAGALAAYADIGRPFSGARSVAEFIARSGLAGEALAAWPGFLCTSVLPYLDAPGCFQADDDRQGTYVTQDRAHRERTRKSERLLRSRIDAALGGAPRFLLLLDGRAPGLEDRCRQLFAQDDVLFDERYVVYGCVPAS